MGSGFSGEGEDGGMVEKIWLILVETAVTGGLGGYMLHSLAVEEKLQMKKVRAVWLASFFLLAAAAWLFYSYGYSFWKTERYLILLYGVTVIAVTDQRRKKIPNRSLLLLLLTRCLILAGEMLTWRQMWMDFLLHAVIGAAGSLILMMAAYYISRRAVGIGDVKLFAVTGFFLGFSLNYIVLFAALAITAVYAGIRIVCKRMSVRDEIAFAPFAAAGLWMVLLLGF